MSHRPPAEVDRGDLAGAVSDSHLMPRRDEGPGRPAPLHPAAVAVLLKAAPARCGAVRVLAVDGPAGSGKTTAAHRLVSELGNPPLVHLDDLLEGWTGSLAAVWDRLDAQLLEPLAAGAPAGYRRFDWEADAFAEWVSVPDTGVLVVEGVGSAAAAVDPRLALRVWVEAPPDLRLRRGVERGGEEQRDNWVRWAQWEARHFAADGTRERADVLVDGTAREVPRAP